MTSRLLLLLLALGCARADQSDRTADGSGQRTVSLDSLTVTDSLGLPVGGSGRIRIAYWAGDRMVYCAHATLAAVDEMNAPILTDERSCPEVQLLQVDSVRFDNGVIIAANQLRDQTSIRIEPRP